MYDLFISYRRDGGYELARLLYTSFKEAGLNPFFDVEELRSGPFDEKLYTYIEESQNFVLVCSPGCLERCANEGDWVKLEIEKAITLKKNIVPVMMKNFDFPDNLPKEIESLKMFNGASINQEYFNASIEKIISLLVNVTPKKAAKIGIEEKKHIEELYNHAMELLGQQSFVQATACFEEIRDIHPGYVRAYWGQLLAMYRCMSN
ncbi:MAG: toll/interleukin-1 receptor domain-containing protein, partial [Clostridia bacterium]|nr:toll/interleukin-1 receptor domain-containing protein [Clostridia bacterium]